MLSFLWLLSSVDCYNKVTWSFDPEVGYIIERGHPTNLEFSRTLLEMDLLVSLLYQQLTSESHDYIEHVGIQRGDKD